METSPKKSREVIRSQSRKVIYNVLKFCKEEKKKGLSIPLQKAVERTARAVGRSERTVRNIARQCEKADMDGSQILTPGKHRARAKKFELDDFDKSAVRRTFLEHYEIRKEIPTLRKLFSAVKEKITFSGKKNTFWRLIKSMGFQFAKCKSGRFVLIERNDIVARRAAYLRALRQNRNGPKRPVVYTDETWIDYTQYKAKNCWQHKEVMPGAIVNQSVGQRTIVVHAGGKMGFIQGAELIYDSNAQSQDDVMNSKNYNMWLQEQLIPNLPPGCIVVFDNASYHTVQENRAPTFASHTDDILSWLKENDILVSEGMTKRELVELVKENKSQPVYTVDRILKENGFSVLRLPPYHCDLNPIELIWNLVKQKVAASNVIHLTPPVLKELTHHGICEVTIDDWMKVCTYIENREEDYWRRDALMEEELERIVVDVGLESSGESDEETNIVDVAASDSDGSSTDLADESANEVLKIKEEPPFISCGSGWPSDTEESFNILPKSMLTEMKFEPDPICANESEEEIKEEPEIETEDLLG